MQTYNKICKIKTKMSKSRYKLLKNMQSYNIMEKKISMAENCTLHKKRLKIDARKAG